MTSIGMAMALLGLALVSATAVIAITRANHRVAAARAVLTPFLELQRTVSGEAVAEAGYRRVPSAGARRRLEHAIASVSVAAGGVQLLADRRDLATLSYLTLLNERYVHEVRATLDEPAGARHDDRVAGPALDAIEALLDGAIDGHRHEAAVAVLDQQQVIGRLELALPAVFVLAFALLGWMWFTMLADHRRLRVHADASEVLARTDALTGLANRLALEAVAGAALGRPRAEAAVLLLDLDGFKPVNDTHGHAVGDLVLVEVARRLSATVRPGELAARIGGDEFVVLVPRGDGAERLAERLLEAVSAPMVLGGTEIAVGTSIGIAHYPADADDYAALLQVADERLYEAKSAGRGVVRGGRLRSAV